jgi:hypothetical protein
VAAASEERENSQPNPQEDPKAKYQATSNKDSQQIPNQELDFVEGSTPSKTEKGKRPVWEEPVVEVPASPGRVNEEGMRVMNKCETEDLRMLDHTSARGKHY